jgi:RNA-splicing ligase RtcB
MCFHDGEKYDHSCPPHHRTYAQILLGAIGSGDDDGDVQVVDACTNVTIHGNVGSGPRGAYLRYDAPCPHV